MTLTIEAIYENGMFKPLHTPLGLREHDRVRLVVDTDSLISSQSTTRLQIEPDILREIVESADYSVLES